MREKKFARKLKQLLSSGPYLKNPGVRNTPPRPWVKFIASAAYRQRTMTLHMAPVIETLADPVGVVQIAQSRRRESIELKLGF